MTDNGRGSSPSRCWTPGLGWGWVWGPDDEVGALNAMTDATRLSALRSIVRGHVYDVGVTVDRHSFLWGGHPHTEVLTFRSPEGAKREGDLDAVANDAAGLAFFSGMVIISDHAGTQIDGLDHVTTGEDDHWYNGFTAREWSGDFGPRRASAHLIPAIVAPAVLIDVATAKQVDELPAHYPISPDDLAAALDRQEVTMQPGDVVLVRTGAMRYWGEAGEDHDAIAGPDSAGITLAAARWLCEEQGAMLIAADTSTVEVVPAVDGTSWAPVHEYLLVEQGVHMGEFFFLEELARDEVWRSCLVALCQKVRGSTAGFAMRPIALT
jgi:kynurenine formamidase